MHIGQTPLQPVVVIGQPFMVQAHEVQECGIEVINRRFVHSGLESEFITLAVTETRLYSRTCQETGKGFGIVIPPRTVRL